MNNELSEKEEFRKNIFKHVFDEVSEFGYTVEKSEVQRRGKNWGDIATCTLYHRCSGVPNLPIRKRQDEQWVVQHGGFSYMKGGTLSELIRNYLNEKWDECEKKIQAKKRTQADLVRCLNGKYA